MTTHEPRFFFIIGAMKAGTTSLYKYLADHPDVYASPRKEPRVFRDAGDPEKQRSEFLALFEGRGAERWCFEASTAYTKYPRSPGVPERLRAIVPEARLVYLVRNPIERAWSHYLHNLAHGRESRSFLRAMADRPQYLDISRYHLQLQQYYAVFPKDRILVQVFEEMTADPAETVRQICTFLDIDDSYRPATAGKAYNSSGDKVAAPAPLRMLASLGVEDKVPWQVRHWLRGHGAPLPAKKEGLTPEVRRELTATLRPDVESLFGALGRRIPAWTDFA